MPGQNLPGNSRHKFARGYKALTLTGAVTLTGLDSEYQFLNPNGTARNVTLPALTQSFGLSFKITNTDQTVTAAALTIKTAAGATLSTCSPGQTVEVMCDGATWLECSDIEYESVLVPRAAAVTVRNLFVAPQALTVVSLSSVLNEAKGGALTGTVVKATSTTAPVKTTTPMFTADSLDLNGALHTVVNYTLTSTAADLTLAAGDRIGIDHGALTTGEVIIRIGYKLI